MTRPPILTCPPIAHFSLEPGFVQLGPDFSTHLQPQALPHPSWVAFSGELAETLGLPPDFTQDPSALQILAGNAVAEKSQPFASVYSGHQFGVWAGQLGDGRAIHLGQVKHQAQAWEIQLKGAGPSPYSRMGDGRAVLRSSIREFLCSEAMHGLGIPTTRALAVISSPAQVLREELETAAVVTRAAPSFIRFGHFEHFAALGQHPQLKTLTQFVLEQHYPHLVPHTDSALMLLSEVLQRSARLVAQWQAVGFCHGVLNTDNMSILGLTLDYGPFGFMDRFALKHICNHTDRQGRYSFANQPAIFYWNIVRLAQALLPVIARDDSDSAQEEAIAKIKPVLGTFTGLYEAHYQQLMSQKLGLAPSNTADHALLIAELVQLLDTHQVDYTFFFRHLGTAITQVHQPILLSLFGNAPSFTQWLERYTACLKSNYSSLDEVSQRMHRVNPKYILRQYLAQNAIEKSQAGDHTLTRALQKCLVQPFAEQPEYAAFAQLPPEWAAHLEVSCSS